MPAESDSADQKLFALALALGTGGLIAASAAVTAAVDAVHRQAPGSRRLVLAGLRFTYPSVNGAGALLLVVAALGMAAVALAGRACWRQARQYRGLIVQIRLGQPLERDRRVKVIAGRRPQAFCAGYLRPAVYVSQRTVELLSEAELSAVLAHEHHHRRVRDPLRFVCVRILGDALFFVPVLARLSERFAELAELNADRAAVRASGGDRAALASALLAFDESGPPGVTGISPERVDSLLGQPIGWRLPHGRIVASSAGLVALGLLIWGSSTLASVRATLNLPVVSPAPCLVMTTLLPLLGCLRMLVRAKRMARPARPWPD